MKFPRLNIFSVCLLSLGAFSWFAISAYGASSVYIPGVPSASSSAIGISCNYGGLGAGTVYCTNQSPGPIVTCSGGVCTSSSGYQNRLIFTIGSYGWAIPAGITKAKVVVIGNGGHATGNNGGGGGGYAEKTLTVLNGNAVTVTVQAGGSSSATSVTLAGVTVSAAAGQSGSLGGAGECGSNGDINTCGGTGGNNSGTGLGGGGAGGPYANGGSSGYGGGGFGNGLGRTWSTFNGQYGGYAFGIKPGQSCSVNPLAINNSIFWDSRDIQGDGGVAPTMPNTGTFSYVTGADGGLGGGGACSYNAGAGAFCGNGGFGGGGGSAQQSSENWGGSGGIGGGGGWGSNNDGVSIGLGGPGIAIIYW